MSGKKGEIYLGLSGSEQLISPFGRKFSIVTEEIGREQRTASGRLVKDIVAIKNKITLTYDTIDGDALTQFLDLYDLAEELSLLVYFASSPTTDDESAYYDQYTVLMAPIARERLLLLSDGLWTGVQIVLSEV